MHQPITWNRSPHDKLSKTYCYIYAIKTAGNWDPEKCLFSLQSWKVCLYSAEVLLRRMYAQLNTQTYTYSPVQISTTKLQLPHVTTCVGTTKANFSRRTATVCRVKIHSYSQEMADLQSQKGKSSSQVISSQNLCKTKNEKLVLCMTTALSSGMQTNNFSEHCYTLLDQI